MKITPNDYRDFIKANPAGYSADKTHERQVRDFVATRDVPKPRKPIDPEVTRLLRKRATAMMDALRDQS